MSDLPALLQPENRDELKKRIRQAAQHNLDDVQMAMWLKVDVRDLRLLMTSSRDLMAEYVTAKVDESIRAMEVIKEIAYSGDPDDKQRFPAARYLYEMFSGHSNRPVTVAIQNISPHMAKTENNIKLIEALDVKILEDIKND
jgi:hypothetical protein